MATIRKRGDKWHVQVRRQGHPTATKSFAKKIDAESWARQHEVDLQRSAFISDQSLQRSTTLFCVLARYRTEVSSLKKGRETEAYRLRAMQRHSIATLTLDQLTTARLAHYRNERLKLVGPSSVRRELAILAHCLEIARMEWRVGLLANPMDGLSLPKAGKARQRRVTPDELEKLGIGLRKSRNGLLVSVINLAIFTGMRRSELLGLTWRNVDEKKGLAFLPDAKNGHPRFVPLCPRARKIIAGLKHGESDDLVLPMSANAVRLSWTRLKRRAGIENLRFHDLRHEAISRFFEAGLSVPEVSLISGHRDPRMLLRYTHLQPETVAERLVRIVDR